MATHKVWPRPRLRMTRQRELCRCANCRIRDLAPAQPNIESRGLRASHRRSSVGQHLDDGRSGEGSAAVWRSPFLLDLERCMALWVLQFVKRLAGEHGELLSIDRSGTQP